MNWLVSQSVGWLVGWLLHQSVSWLVKMAKIFHISKIFIDHSHFEIHSPHFMALGNQYRVAVCLCS